MTRPENVPKKSFAYVYDALYGGDTPFLQAQLDFLQAIFGPPPGPLLDIGCGTGLHVAGLSRLGYTMVGIDVDPLMLRVARRNLPSARLVHADMRRLSFCSSAGGPFQGALCLESPLAYLMTREDLLTALTSMRAAIRGDGTLVVDVYDYPATLGTRPAGAHTAHFETDRMGVTVAESHRYEKKRRLWTMRQAFQVEEYSGQTRFEVVHRLRIRSADEYVDAVNAAGFKVLEALTGYPGTPEASARERRIVLVARRGNSG